MKSDMELINEVEVEELDKEEKFNASIDKYRNSISHSLINAGGQNNLGSTHNMFYAI